MSDGDSQFGGGEVELDYVYNSTFLDRKRYAPVTPIHNILAERIYADPPWQGFGVVNPY